MTLLVAAVLVEVGYAAIELAFAMVMTGVDFFVRPRGLRR